MHQHFLEGAQQFTTLFESAFAEFGNSQIEAFAAAQQQTRCHTRHILGADLDFIGVCPQATRFPTAAQYIRMSQGLYEALEKTGNRPVRALQRLRAVLLTGEQAKLLKAQERDAGLLVARVGYLKDGQAVEYSQSFYRGEIYDFVRTQIGTGLAKAALFAIRLIA